MSARSAIDLPLKDIIVADRTFGDLHFHILHGLKVFCLFASPCGARGEAAFVLVVAIRSKAMVRSSATACSRFIPKLSSSADTAVAPASDCSERVYHTSPLVASNIERMT